MLSNLFDQIPFLFFFPHGTIYETSSPKNTFWGRLSSKANELRSELGAEYN